MSITNPTVNSNNAFLASVFNKVAVESQPNKMQPTINLTQRPAEATPSPTLALHEHQEQGAQRKFEIQSRTGHSDRFDGWKASSARVTIQSHLSGKDKVTDKDVEAIAKKLAELNSEEVDSVFRFLSDNDVNKLTTAVGTANNATARTQILDKLVKGLSNHNLERVGQSFRNNPSLHGAAEEFGQLVEKVRIKSQQVNP